MLKSRQQIGYRIWETKKGIGNQTIKATPSIIEVQKISPLQREYSRALKVKDKIKIFKIPTLNFVKKEKIEKGEEKIRTLRKPKDF